MVKRKIHGATNRKKEEDLKSDIISFLKENKNPISTQEIASHFDKPWHSIQTRCLQLQVMQKINGFRVGRINLWQIKN